MGKSRNLNWGPHWTLSLRPSAYLCDLCVKTPDRMQRSQSREPQRLRGDRFGVIKYLNMPERIYRDPVHNIIRLQTDSDEGELMMRLIDAAEFQRLRRIKQLGLGLYTYQGADHSRFTHSLGA